MTPRDFMLLGQELDSMRYVGLPAIRASSVPLLKALGCTDDQVRTILEEHGPTPEPEPESTPPPA